jgi:hypothetical protein
MDVLEDDHERAAHGELFEQLPDGPERLLDAGRGGRHPEQSRQPLGDDAGVLARAEELQQLGGGLRGRAELAHPDGVLDHVDDRPERDALAVG